LRRRARDQPAAARHRGGAAAGRAAHPQGPANRPARRGDSKPTPDDLRDSPALDIARLLLARGARVKLHDPIAGDRFRHEQPELAPHLSETVDGLFDDCDAVVLVTEWAQYLEMDWSKFVGLMRTPILLDGRHALDGRPNGPARLQISGNLRLAPETPRPAAFPGYPT